MYKTKVLFIAMIAFTGIQVSAQTAVDSLAGKAQIPAVSLNDSIKTQDADSIKAALTLSQDADSLKTQSADSIKVSVEIAQSNDSIKMQSADSIKVGLTFTKDTVAAAPEVRPSAQKAKMLSALSIGLNLSPSMGYGLEVATPLSSKFIVRAGFTITAGIKTDYANFAVPDDDDLFYEAFGYAPEFRANMGIAINHGNLLLDFHPHGLFHITAGIFVGQTKALIKGRLVDWHDPSYPDAQIRPGYKWPTIELVDQTLETEGGKADIDLRFGQSIIKPYFGIGIGRAVPLTNHRLAFKAELGIMYHGAYSIKQGDRKIDLGASTDPDLRDIHDIINMVQVWPQLNLLLSYRIF
ncbi:MAG: hypothetical protein LBH04_03855 [Tannerellaceae bacterium]|jgi:hypothetical protein|nr:hypothetical protein [Tannerellaceae bacterium]